MYVHIHKVAKNIRKSFFLLSCIFISNWANAQVSGKVFHDYNANGVRNTTSTVNAADGNPVSVAVDNGIAGVTVTAYNAAGTSVGSASTASDGTYTITGVTGAVRVEFTNLPANYFSGPMGSNSSTSVQFVTAPATNVDLGINRPWDYSEDNPLMVTNCFAPLANNGVNANMDVLVTIPNNAGSTQYLFSGPGGSAISPPTGYNQPTPTHIATHSQIGTTWGLAWQRSKKSIYVGAFIKQFTDLGPGGTGAIYKVDMTNPASPVTSLFADLNAIFGAGTSGDNPFVPYPDFNVATDRERVAVTPGRVALGDIDVSEDDKWLFVSNLKDHKIYSIPIDGSPINSSTVKVSPKVPYPSTTYLGSPVSDLQMITHGMAVKDGKVYIAASKGREESATEASTHYLRANFIYEYDPLANTFNSTPILTYDLTGDYPKDKSLTYISDFVFAPDGSMVVTFRYLYSDAMGGVTASYLLKACPNGSGQWIMEDHAGNCGGTSTAGLGMNLYALENGTGLWYWQAKQAENSYAFGNGGLVQIPGFPYVTTTAYDPYRVYTAGLVSLSHNDGTYVKGVDIFPEAVVPPTSGVAWDNKRGVLGEVEALSSAAPIEIGNRVWTDTDDDGIQDAGEAGISGITVTLCAASAPTTPIATAATDANGNYYFSSASGTSTSSAIYGLNLAYETAYILKFPTTASGKAISTKPNIGANDLIDSDASAAGQIAFSTGTMGQNNHTFDVGYAPSACITPTATASATPPTCNGATANSDGKITIAGFTAGQRYQYTSGSSFTGTATPATITAIPVGGVVASTLPNTASSYTVRIYDATDDACFVDRIVTTTITDCSCPVINAGTDVTICLPKTTLDLADASSGYEWVIGSGNPVAAAINASTGQITGLTAIGTYTFRLRSTTLPSVCFDDIVVTVTNGDAAIMLCNDGSTSYTLIAQAGITNVVWYNMAGQQVGTGTSLVVTSNTSGLSDGSEAFYYQGIDSSTCGVELCCPVKFITQNCCPIPNCLGITVIKN